MVTFILLTKSLSRRGTEKFYQILNIKLLLDSREIVYFYDFMILLSVDL